MGCQQRWVLVGKQRGTDVTQLALLIRPYLVSTREVVDLRWDNVPLEEDGMLSPQKQIPCQSWPDHQAGCFLRQDKEATRFSVNTRP